MVGKNNKQARWSKSANTFKRYSLKKLSVGVASVVIGTGVAWATGTTVEASELDKSDQGIEDLLPEEEVAQPVEEQEVPVTTEEETTVDKLAEEIEHNDKETDSIVEESAEEDEEIKTFEDSEFEFFPMSDVEGYEEGETKEDETNDNDHTDAVSLVQEDPNEVDPEPKSGEEDNQVPSRFLRAVQSTDYRRLPTKKLEQNPPTFYPNRQIVLPRPSDGGTSHRFLRTTGILAGDFFPDGTTFELRNKDFRLSDGGGRTGWYGVRPNKDGELDSLSSGTTKFHNSPNNHPHVVSSTGQVLFSLGTNVNSNKNAAGQTVTIPMRATYTDETKKRVYTWDFDQVIQMSDSPQVGNRADSSKRGDDSLAFVGSVPAESKRKQGDVVFGTRIEALSYIDWYSQTMGSIGQWMPKKQVPKYNLELAHKQNELYDPTAVTTPVETEVGTTPDASSGISNTTELPDDTKYEWVNPDIFNTPTESGNADVKVTYPDKTSEIVKVPIRVLEATQTDNISPVIEPIEDKEFTEGSEIEPIQVTTSDDSGEAPTVTVDGLPAGLTYNKENGTISGTPDKIEEGQPREFNVTVKSTDGSGNEATETFKLTVNPAAPSVSGYEDKTITEGRLIEPIIPEITNKGEGDITAKGLPDGLNINPETGEITGTPDVTDWNDNFNSENPSASEFEDERDFRVTVTVPGQPERTAEFTITVQRDTDGDGTADVNDPDSDDDGINDNVELERGTNPKDANDFKGPELSVNTPKKGEETVSGKTEPQTSVTVKDTDGTVIGQGVSDEEGNFKVPVNRPLKGGEELDVTAGDPNTKNDQTTDRVTVYTPQSDIYEPQGNPIFVEKNGTPNPADGIANKDELPEGTEFGFDGPVDTSTPGKKDVNVKITYPDGSEESITVPLHVSDEDTPQSEIFEPQGQDIEVPEGSELDAADGIANKDELPEGTEFEFDGPVDTSTPGEKKAKVIVAYPDGSTDTVDVTVNVTEVPTQADKHEPKGQDIEVPEGAEPDAANGIANKDELPEGTEFEFDGPVDTSTPGKKKAKVIVAYPDGSTDTVDVTVNVTEVPTQADNHEPKGNPIFVEKNGTPNAADGIANKDELPEGTEFEFDGPVDTSTPGEKKAKVIVAYPDGSTDTVDVTVNVTDGDTPQSEIFEPQGQDIEVPEGGKPNAADGIANKDELPEGTEFEFDGPVDTSTPGKKKAKVIVAYPDGSTDTVDVTVNVTPKAPGKTTAETLEPKWNDSDAKDGGPVTVPNTGDKIPAGSTTTATITEDPNNKGKANWTVTVGEDGSVTVTPGADAQPGDSATVTVETTYPDGSKDSSSFKVTVPAVGPTHAHGDSLVHDKPSYDLDKLGHGQTQPSRPAEDKAQTPAVDKAGLPNYVPSQSGERLPDTATGAWVLGVVGLMSTGLGSALGLKRKKEDEE